MPRRALITMLLAASALSTHELAAQTARSTQPEPESVGERFRRNNNPAGLRLGPWEVTPDATLRGGYDDNVTTVAEDAVASPIVELRGRVDVVNRDGADSFTAFAEVRQTWVTDATDLDRFDASGGIAADYQVSEYVRIRGAIGVNYAAEADDAGEGIIVGGVFDPFVDLSEYLAVPASIGVSVDTGRWFVTASGQMVWSDFEDRTTRSGVIINQDYRNGYIGDVSLRAGWRLTPATGLFVEGGYNLQRFRDENADSDGWRAVAGAEFELTRLLTGDIFAGYAAQSFTGGDEVTGLTYGASLNWFPTELISVHLAARRDFTAEQTVLDAGIARTSPVTRDSVGLRVEYEPLRQFLITAQGGWSQSSYEGQDRTDQRFYAGLGLEYVFTPNFRLNLDYRYEDSASDVSGDATRNVIMLGVSARY